MKEELKNLIISNIQQWDEPDIYAISLFVYDENDNPCKPTVTLGYNTERQVKNETPNASDELEARWNYAFWIQNEFFCFGTDETAGCVKDWILQNGLPYYEDDEVWNDEEAMEEAEGITERFVDELVEIVQEIHQKKVLTEKFGKEMPILIHELEYYDEILEQNVIANGRQLTAGFAAFCGE